MCCDMKLAQYLTTTKISQSAFAEVIRVTQPAVNRYVNERRVPDTDTIKRIEIATGGKVRWSDWHPEIARHLKRSERTGAPA